MLFSKLKVILLGLDKSCIQQSLHSDPLIAMAYLHQNFPNSEPMYGCSRFITKKNYSILEPLVRLFNYIPKTIHAHLFSPFTRNLVVSFMMDIVLGNGTDFICAIIKKNIH